MTLSQSPPVANRNRQFTSATALTTFDPPIGWVLARGPGTVTMKDERGTAVAFTGVLAGDVLPGPFSEFTSTTCSVLWLGDGAPPPASPATSAFSQLYIDATSSQGLIWLPPSAFYLLTGAPLAIFANGASAVPGSALVDSKGFAVRYNNNSTLNGILTSFPMPPDCDITFDMTVSVYASKTGATSGDAVTFAIGAFNQVVGALDDADTDFGGTTTAMSGAATAKTVQVVTLALAAANLAASPASVTMSLKPTDGTLGTDDLCVFGVRIAYTKKLLTF